MKFKVGDKVKLNPNLKGADFKHSQGFATHDEIGVIHCIEEDGDIVVNFPSQNGWYGLEDELILMTIEVGDTVRINKNITLADLPKNHWNGCQSGTMEFLTRESIHDFKREFTVTKLRANYIEIEDFTWCISKDLFELVEKKEVKEMTIEEISKALGYEVKVVK